MPENNNDVKPVESSSDSQTEQSVVKETSQEASTTPAQSTTESGDSDILTLAKNLVKEQTASQAKVEDEKEEVEEEKDETKEAVVADEVEAEKEEVDETKPVPYERFKEVNSTKTELEKRWNEVQPVIDAQKSLNEFCQSNNVTPEEFEYWVNVAALVKTNPQRALEFLKPQLEQLQSFTGDRLTPELQAAVANGEISLDWAKKIAASESQIKHQTKTTKLTQEQQAQRVQQEYSQSLDSALTKWIESKQTKIPEFKPKVGDAADGLLELWAYKFAATAKTAKINSPDELVALADRSFAELQSSLSRFSPKQSTGPKVSSTQARSNSSTKPINSINDAVSAALKMNGATVISQ